MKYFSTKNLQFDKGVALTRAAQDGDISLMQKLREWGYCFDENGNTYAQAVKTGNEKIIEILENWNCPKQEIIPDNENISVVAPYHKKSSCVVA